MNVSVYLFIVPVDGCCLNVVAAKLGNSWKDLGRELPGIEENEIENIISDNKRQIDQCTKMLHTWSQKKGSEATMMILYYALNKCGRNDIKLTLETHLKDEH